MILVDRSASIETLARVSPIRLAKRLSSDFGLAAWIGCELEFYVRPAHSAAAVSHAIASWIAGRHLLETLSSEEGPGQLEVSTRPSANIEEILAEFEEARAAFEAIAGDFGAIIDWRSRPSRQVPGSALHVHVDLRDGQGFNVFQRGGDNRESEVLLAVIDGLLDTLPSLLPAFAPTANCFERYLDVPYPAVVHHPTRICWGPENRGAALRVPACGVSPQQRRIEHRVAGSAACLSTALGAILMGVHQGLSRPKTLHHPRIHGLPNHPLHGLPRLPDRASALEKFDRDGARLVELYRD